MLYSSLLCGTENTTEGVGANYMGRTYLNHYIFICLWWLESPMSLDMEENQFVVNISIEGAHSMMQLQISMMHC